jgi:uncharacterized protein (DUF736 family)
MIIGNFAFDPEHDSYSGEISTLTLQRMNVRLRPISKTTDREPDYRIVQERDDRFVELGAAWKRRSERGTEFLSVVLDDPALPSALNAALFLEDRGGLATLVWQRPAKKQPSPTAEAAGDRAPTARRTSAARGPRPG